MDEIDSPLLWRELTPEEKKKNLFWNIVGIIGFIMIMVSLSYFFR